MKKIFFLLLFMAASVFYAQENVDKAPSKGTKAYDVQVEKTKTQWKYNPFRKSAKEMLLFGWQNPYAFITRFWIGGVINLPGMFPNPAYGAQNAGIAFTPVLATEVNAIPFMAHPRLKVNIGVGFMGELYFLVFRPPTYPRHGKVHMQGDVLNVSVFIDFIIDESWRLRIVPIAHYCAHAGGDYYGDPALQGAAELVDYGYEGSTLELYYNWKFLTVYGGIRFPVRNHMASHYSTLFAGFLGMDFRVPIWGAINFITGFYLAAEYNTFNTLFRHPTTEYTLLKSEKMWDINASFGIGIEIDRIAFAFRYKTQRSRQIISYKHMDSRYGFEITLYF